MITVDSWTQYVDEVLSTIGNGVPENPEMINAYKEHGIAEYEPGINPEEFKKILEGLEVGDIIVFCFKRFSKWPMTFLALFSTRTSCFEYIADQLPSFEAINYMAMSNERYSAYLIKCKIIDAPISKEHTVDWIVRYLGISLKDVTVKKPK